MSQTADSFIHTGTWINWSQGRILGSTITLSERNGGLLTAFLATFVATAGVACWAILSYTLHQTRARQDRASTIHHQQQATLRNAGTPSSATWQFLQIYWYWRKNAVRPLARTLPLLLVALLNIVFFAVASIFSSYVTRAAGNEVLIRSPRCGALIPKDDDYASQQAFSDFKRLETNDTSVAASYSRACYGDVPDPLQCNQYAQRSLPWESNPNVTCPFAPELCLLGPTAAYQMDTGPLDSHRALGINAPLSDRVLYRKVTTCSPINGKNRFEAYNDTDPSHMAYGDTLVGYLFGPVDEHNYTFQYNMHSLAEYNGYELTSLVAFAGGADRGWEPIPALSRTDGDVSIFFLTANSVTYQEPVIDPFYIATTPEQKQFNDANLTFYSPDFVINVMACVDQHQFCNPFTRQCTPLNGAMVLNANRGITQLNLNVAQYTTALLIILHIAELTTYSSVHSRGANALRASETLNDNSQIGLPNTQWMTEISSWFGISMAKLQQRVVQYATGPSTIPDSYELFKPQTAAERNICNNQIIRKTNGTTSFSVLGVAIILIIGTILIITSWTLDTCVRSIRGKKKSNQYKSLQWIVDEKLQLQRLAYEEAGQGRWREGASTVPLTEKDDKIGLPRNANMEHPSLSQLAGHTVITYPGTPPETEGLMEQKGR
ncbi:MAG: hypothetical protein L6R38_005678 [Xanthoria sp. 2 TBL-2021]|nr:MAG: hypothetical protein L6R38_005678 [Xanthoria sp. 2 TBL-2021]